MNDDRKGVLVILTGGNICLVAAEDKRRQAGVNHRPATIEEFKEIVLGDKKSENLLSREKYIHGINLKVDFYDLRKDVDRISTDPEELDSSQLAPELWASIAQVIHDKYLNYEGFVILHGLDTMAYTASGLSFMLQSLNSPVVLTGSQRPLNYSRTDAVQNIRAAIIIAGAATVGVDPVIPEVMVYCFDSLLRGNRSSMVHASSYRAFDSPNYPPLGTFGEHIEIQSISQRKLKKTKRIVLRKNVQAMVTILDVFPGINPDLIKQLAETPGLRGVLLRTYGLGTAPTAKQGILQALKKIVDANIVVMNVTQAQGGRISYREDPVSLRLSEQGVISGADMIAEAAYAKMVVLLSESEIVKTEHATPQQQREIVEDLLQIDQCGEQSQSIFHFHFGKGETVQDKDGNFSAILETTRPMVERHLLETNFDKITYIQLVILGLQPSEGGGKYNRLIEFEVFIVGKQQDGYEVIKSVRQDVLRWHVSGKKTINITCDISDSQEHIMNPATRLRIITTEPVKWEKMRIAIYAKITH